MENEVFVTSFLDNKSTRKVWCQKFGNFIKYQQHFKMAVNYFFIKCDRVFG